MCGLPKEGSRWNSAFIGSVQSHSSEVEITPLFSARLHVFDNKVDVNAALGGGGVLPLGEDGSGRAPAESPVLASYRPTLASYFKQHSFLGKTYRTS